MYLFKFMMYVIYTDYSEEKAYRILNSELADKFGNLLNRCTGASLNPRQVWPALSSESEKILCGAAKQLIEEVSALPGNVTTIILP
jgi:methionyl-tRNA synthetase